MFNFLVKWFGPKTDFRKLLEEGAVIVDVRTPAEFRSGHIPGSQNVPLNELQGKIQSLKKSGKPVITVCRSGARSSMAKNLLSASGLAVYNGGAWNRLQHQIQ